MRDNTPEVPEDVDIKLKPFLGLQPTTYLPVIYGVVVAAILFLLLVLPGIIRPGTVLTVISTPPNAAVSVDGLIRGSSGDGVFVPAGHRVIGVTKPGHHEYSQELTIRRRLIGSLFVPRRQTLVADLSAISTDLLVISALSDFSEWSLFGEASGQYQFPPVARELGRNLAGTKNGVAYAEFLGSAVAHLDSESQLNDLLAGALVARSGGSSPSALSVAAVVQSAAQIAADAPGFPVQLQSMLSGRRSEQVAESAWGEYSERQMTVLRSEPRVSPSRIRAPVRSLSGIAFVEVPSGSGLVGGASRAERGGDIPYPADVENFLLSQTEVTVADYSRFLNANPKWSPDNVDGLVSEELADADYLRDWRDGEPTATAPVRNVSAYAAEAFAAWFSSTIEGTALVARLPTETEWDYVAALDAPDSGVFASSTIDGPAPVSESGRGLLGLYGLAGNVWEWTGDQFETYSRIHGHQGDDAPSTAAAHRTVRGGGWATIESDFVIDDRGSMPADWCSGAVGFRIVLAER